jgi:hypothetical protein
MYAFQKEFCFLLQKSIYQFVISCMLILCIKKAHNNFITLQNYNQCWSIIGQAIEAIYSKEAGLSPSTYTDYYTVTK